MPRRATTGIGTGYGRSLKRTVSRETADRYFSKLFERAERHVRLNGAVYGLLPTGLALRAYDLIGRHGERLEARRDEQCPDTLVVFRRYGFDEVARFSEAAGEQVYPAQEAA